jgi:hypothetical protein
MSRPTQEELDTALERAAWLRENGADEYFVGKSLLNHNYRIKHLEQVLKAAKNYLHSGMSAGHELSVLQKAIEHADEANQYKEGGDGSAHGDVVV